MDVKRVAIIGTAPSWVKCPWNDPTLKIWSLNDAYMSRDQLGRGIPRADAWWEIHPLDKMFFRPKENRVVRAEDVPPGHFIRPEGHIEWLKQQAVTIPVYLHPTQELTPDWPVNARRFDLERAEATFGSYWSSGPSYMLAQAILDGYEEIHIYGIHLSTQQEYIEQRPGFEHILGIARGRGIRVLMADESPVLKHAWRYGIEPRPQTKQGHPDLIAARKELAEIRKQKQQLTEQLVHWPRFKSKAVPMQELKRLGVLEVDLTSVIQRFKMNGTVTAVVAA